MIEIGVQTKGICKEDEFVYGMAKIHRAGFTRVDFNLDIYLKNTDVYGGNLNTFFDQETDALFRYFAPLKDAMDKYGIKPSQMHAPYPVKVKDKEEQNNYMMEEVIPKSLAIAGFLSIPWVVVHPIKMQYYAGKEAERQENLAYFKSLISFLKKYNVRVCVENLYESMNGRIVEGVCADPEDVVWYIDSLNEYAGGELFGLCLDTGHLQLVHRDPYRYIKTVGNRIKLLHLHENDFIGDLHQMPFTFGNDEVRGLDWESVIRGLREVGFDGTLSFETFPCMNSFPKGLREEVLKMIYEIGVYFREEIEKYD